MTLTNTLFEPSKRQWKCYLLDSGYFNGKQKEIKTVIKGLCIIYSVEGKTNFSYEYIFKLNQSKEWYMVLKREKKKRKASKQERKYR